MQMDLKDKILKMRHAAIERWREDYAKRGPETGPTKERREMEEVVGKQLEEREVDVEQIGKRKAEQDMTRQESSSRDSDEYRASETGMTQQTSGRKRNLTSFDSEMLDRLPSFLESSGHSNKSRFLRPTIDQSLSPEYSNSLRTDNVSTSEASEAGDIEST